MAGPKGQRVAHRVPELPPAARRHCWVSGPADSPCRHAGLVVGWQRTERGWMAQVAYVIEDDGALVVQWLSSDIVRPAAH